MKCLRLLLQLIGLKNINMDKKKKQKETKSDILPLGLKHSIIPQSYLDKVGDNWDKSYHLYQNKIIIK